MLKRAIVVPILVAGLMTLWMGVALADSHGADGNATSTDSGLDDPNATSTDPVLDDPATSTDSIVVTGEGDDDPHRRSFPGTVHYLGDDMVTVAGNGSGEMVDIDISEADVKTPGGPNNQGMFDEEANIVVHAEWDGSQWVAIWVIVKPVRPTFTALVGTVIGTEDGVTSIVLPNGKTKKIKNPDGEAEPQDGEVVTVFIDESGEGEGDDYGEPAEATGLVSASAISDRIESFLEKLAAKDASLPQAAIDARQRLVTNLAVVLDKHSAQQVSIIKNAGKAQGLGSGVAARLEEALANAEARRDNGKAIANHAKSKVGVAQGAGESGKGANGSGADVGPNDAGNDSSSGSDEPGGPGKPDGAGSKSDGKGK